MWKLIGAAAVLAGCAGILTCWQSSCRIRIRQMGQLVELYGSARNQMKHNRVSMIVFFQKAAARAKDIGEEDMFVFTEALHHALTERRYATGEEAWEEAMQCVTWHLKKDERALVCMSASAFFGRDLSENLKKLSYYEAQMEELKRNAAVEYAKKNRVWTPAGMLLGLLLVVVLL